MSELNDYMALSMGMLAGGMLRSQHNWGLFGGEEPKSTTAELKYRKNRRKKNRIAKASKRRNRING